MGSSAPVASAASGGDIRAILARCALPLVVIGLVTTWPWAFQNHAHWRSVEWVPFTYYRQPGDWLANVGLFVPLGAAYGWGGTSRRRVRDAVLAGLAYSLAIELTQVCMHGRSPTVSDVLANTLGAWLGAWWAVARMQTREAASASAVRSSPAPPLRVPSGPR